jgi:hypothetical protein
LATVPRLAFVATEPPISPCPCPETEGDQAADTHIPFRIWTRPWAIPRWRAAGDHERHEPGGEGAVGMAERSDGDENIRQVSGCRHGGWRAMPSLSMQPRTGVRRRLRHAAAPCGPPVTPLACVVVKPVTTVTKRYIDDRLGKRFAIGWVPDTIVFMNAVPKASVGKFDKCAAAS